MLTLHCHAAPEIAPQLPSELSDTRMWGQLQLCIPESQVLDSDPNQFVAADPGCLTKACMDGCLVAPLFSSTDPAYSHHLGSMMRTMFQVWALVFLDFLNNMPVPVGIKHT